MALRARLVVLLSMVAVAFSSTGCTTSPPGGPAPVTAAAPTPWVAVTITFDPPWTPDRINTTVVK